MMMFLAEETFWDLLHSSAHWQFEIFLMLIFDVGIGVVAWPLIKRAVRSHDARKHAHQHCEQLHAGLVENLEVSPRHSVPDAGTVSVGDIEADLVFGKTKDGMG